MKNNLKQYIANILVVTLFFSPMQSFIYADEISDTGRESQEFGQELISGFNNQSSYISGPSMVLPSMDNGTFSDSGSSTIINMNDLFPGTSQTSTMSEYLPEGAVPDIDDLQGVSTDSDAMDELGEDTQTRLWLDARRENPTSTSGAAYKIMMDMTNQPRPDLKDDPVFDVTREIYGNIDEISETFGDCTATTALTDIGRSTRLPNLKNCERILDRSTSCELTHVLEAGIVSHVDGPFNRMPTPGIENSLDVWIGRVGNNYWAGNCSIYEEETVFRVNSPQAISRVTLENVVWDDYIQVWIGNEENEELVWQGPNRNFPPETEGACELDTSWNESPGVDITPQFRRALIAGSNVIRFKIRVSVTDRGEGYAKLAIQYNPELAVSSDTWTPQSCLNEASQGIVGVNDGFASSRIYCSRMMGNLTQQPYSYRWDEELQEDVVVSWQDCRFMNEVMVCEEDLNPVPLPGNLPRFCETIQVDIDYDFYKGSLDCFMDASGQRICPQAGNGVVQNCEVFEDNPDCGFISSDCIQGSEANSGTCYAHNEVWDCGTDITVPDIDSTLEMDCAGPIRCMGDDCIDPNKTESASFAEVSAQLQAAQFMAQDMNCTEVTGTENVTCTVFGGDGLQCKKAMGGVQDCCDVPTQVTMATYLKGILAVGTLDTGIMALETGSSVKGAWEVLRTPVADSINAVTKPFTSYIDSMSANVTEYFSPVTDFVDTLVTDMQTAIDQVIKDMVGEAGTDMGASAAASESGGQAMEAAGESAIGSAASTLMTAYTAYVVTVMAIQMLYECEEGEFELAAKKATKSCQYLGSYCANDVLGVCIEKRESHCCFNSPLSRIINAQVRPQIDRPYGDLSNPDCGGLTMDQIAGIDWSVIDLSEWTAILAANELLPDVNAMTIDSITGTGSAFNKVEESVDRLDAEQRTLARLGDTDVDQIRKDVASGMTINPRGSLAVVIEDEETGGGGGYIIDTRDESIIRFIPPLPFEYRNLEMWARWTEEYGVEAGMAYYALTNIEELADWINTYGWEAYDDWYDWDVEGRGLLAVVTEEGTIIDPRDGSIINYIAPLPYEYRDHEMWDRWTQEHSVEAGMAFYDINNVEDLADWINIYGWDAYDDWYDWDVEGRALLAVVTEQGTIIDPRDESIINFITPYPIEYRILENWDRWTAEYGVEAGMAYYALTNIEELADWINIYGWDAYDHLYDWDVEGRSLYALVTADGTIVSPRDGSIIHFTTPLVRQDRRHDEWNIWKDIYGSTIGHEYWELTNIQELADWINSVGWEGYYDWVDWNVEGRDLMAAVTEAGTIISRRDGSDIHFRNLPAIDSLNAGARDEWVRRHSQTAFNDLYNAINIEDFADWINTYGWNAYYDWVDWNVEGL